MKYNKIETEIQDYIKDNISYFIGTPIDELHHNLFNTDYYIIGTYKATQWLGGEVFEAIDKVRDYEEMHFGELTTDIADPEKLVNMLVYIVGEEILQEIDILQDNFSGGLTEEIVEELIEEIG